MDLQSLLGKDLPVLGANNVTKVEDFVSASPAARGGIFDVKKMQHLNPLSIYQLFLTYKDVHGVAINADDFLQYMSNVIVDEDCVKSEMETQDQSRNDDWYELKFGRVTASRVYEVCRCKTELGSLTERVMGASGAIVTEPVTRGQKLESLVLQQIEKKNKNKNK